MSGTKTMKERIDQLVVQFKADLLAQVRLLLTKTDEKEESTKEEQMHIPVVDEHGNVPWKDMSDYFYQHCGTRPLQLGHINGDKCWFNQQGEIHRDTFDENGDVHPAVICANGNREWWLNGKRHRQATSGVEKPAIIRANGEQEWWVDGKCIKKLLFKTA